MHSSFEGSEREPVAKLQLVETCPSAVTIFPLAIENCLGSSDPTRSISSPSLSTSSRDIMFSSEPLSGHAITAVNVPEKCATSKGRANLFWVFLVRRRFWFGGGVGKRGIVGVAVGGVIWSAANDSGRESLAYCLGLGILGSAPLYGLNLKELFKAARSTSSTTIQPKSGASVPRGLLKAWLLAARLMTA